MRRVKDATPLFYGPLIAFKHLGTSVVTSCSTDKVKCKNTDLDEYILDNKLEIILADHG